MTGKGWLAAAIQLLPLLVLPRLDESQMMSRCSVCNAAAFRRISPEEAAAHPEVTERLRTLVTEFWECGRQVCGCVLHNADGGVCSCAVCFNSS